MGNPIIWWGSTISLFISTLVALGLLIRRGRYGGGRGTRKHANGGFDSTNGTITKPGDGLTPREWAQFWHVARIAGGGWALHYIPFLIMGRVTYIHHYVSSFSFLPSQILTQDVYVL